MCGMTESPRVKRINELCRQTRAALHIPTNRRFQVVMEIPGAGFELKDLLERTEYATWAAWTNPEVWRLV